MTKHWSEKVRSLLSAGLFDQQSENRPILDTLVNGKTLINGEAPVTTQRENAFTIPVSQYIEESRIVGRLERPLHQDDDVLDLVEPSTPGVITVIRGIPDVALLHDIGSRLEVPPENMLEHLKFPKSYRIRPLPSRATHCITVRFITLGSYVSHQPLNPSTILHRSQRLALKMETHHEEYLKNERIGVDFFRETNLHDSGFFSVEQQATFFSYRESTKHHGWSGILLTDSGQVNMWPPWRAVAPEAYFHPISLSGSSSSAWQGQKIAGNDPRLRRPEPFLSRQAVDHAMSEHEELLASEDWFIFAADLLDTSAVSWRKFLSFIRASHETISGDPEYQAGRLRADKKVLDRASQYFEDIIRFICSRNHDAIKSSDTDYAPVAANFAHRLLDDFQVLREEASGLSKLCSESIGIAMNTISIADSRKSLAQAQRTQIITYLAYLFLPLSLISSLFGMNVQELSDPGPKIWIYFAIALPFTILSILFPQLMAACRRCFDATRKQTQSLRESDVNRTENTGGGES